MPSSTLWVHVPPNRFIAVARNEEGFQGRKHCARAPEAAENNGPTAEARNDLLRAGPKRPHANGLAAADRRPHIPVVASTDGRPAIDYTGWKTDLAGAAPISECAKLFAESGEYDAALTPDGYRVAIHRAPSSSGYYNDAPKIWDAIEPAIQAARDARKARGSRG